MYINKQAFDIYEFRMSEHRHTVEIISYVSFLFTHTEALTHSKRV